MDSVNHYNANCDFRILYSDFQDRIAELSAFLRDIHNYVSKTESRLNKDIGIYSMEWEELYYANSYGQRFRDSFIFLVAATVESSIKSFIKCWIKILNVKADIKFNNTALDILKDIDKEYCRINIDFSKKEIIELKGLLGVRNSIVHSSGTFEYVQKYKPIINQLTNNYSSIEIVTGDDDFIVTSEQFCWDSLQIIESFYFYIIRISLRKFPNYKEEQPDEDLMLDF